MNNPEAYALLRKHVENFAGIPDRDWALLLPHLQIKKLRKHQFFAQEGKKAAEVGLVLEGMFRQYYTKDSEEKTTYFFFENHFLSAYISCITDKPSLITIEALSDSVCVTFPYRILRQLFDKSLAWQKFGRLMAEYLTIGLEERMASLLLKSPEERYVDLLVGNKKKILERVPQHYIASYLGVTPVSLSRIRNRVLKK
ncbi:MAG: Crp/Fnr family transcriptional regulator [Ferruginibacter sp.]|nr:Crp/Fnr family transcriptional regulator [Cytophagales bacterium]